MPTTVCPVNPMPNTPDDAIVAFVNVPDFNLGIAVILSFNEVLIPKIGGKNHGK